MKILFLLPQLPYPPRKGAAFRNYYFIRWLAREHRVFLLAFAERAEVPAHLRDLCAGIRVVPPPVRRLADRLHGLYRSSLPDLALRLGSPAYDEALRAWLAEERFDVVQVECLEMAAHWLAVSAALPQADRPLVVFDDHNAEYLLQWRACRTDIAVPRRWPAAAYSLVQAVRLRRYEGDVCALADRVIAVSEEDAAALRALRPALQPLVIPNGVDCEYFAYDPPGGPAPRPPQIVFAGTMDFRPNVDAVAWFAHAVLPRVRQRIPEARFVVVGARPAPAVQRLAAQPGVVVTGAVEDVRPYLAQSRVYVVPMRMGGGVRLKALEAMAVGLPVVSTGLGCAGIAVQPGVHYLRAEDPSTFAERVSAVLSGEADCRAMVDEARALMTARYDWGRLCPALAAAYVPRAAAGRQ